MGITEFLQQEIEQENNEYLEKNHIREVMQPKDPLCYIEECVQKIRLDADMENGVKWDIFLPKPSITKPKKDGIFRRNLNNITIIPSIKREKKVMESKPDPIIHAHPLIPPITKKSSRDEKSWKNIIFVLGGPGSGLLRLTKGKGTQCVRLAVELNYAHLSVGDLLREEVSKGSEIGIELDKLMRDGKIVPMDVTLRLLKDAMEKCSDKDGFLIDGFPRKLDQAFEFEKSIAPCKLVLYYECSEAVMLERLVERGKTSGRADDNIETIKKRFKTFLDASYPVVDYFLQQGKCCRISSERPVEKIYQESLEVIRGSNLGHPNIIFVLGGPGSGKGTQCAKLVQEFGLKHISTGDLLRREVEQGSEIGREASNLMKEGKMVPLPMILSLLKAEIQSNIESSGFLIDGFPRTMEQAILFERTIGDCRKVLAYKCPFDVLEKRLIDRGKTSGRADDNIETIKKRFDAYENQSMPVIEFYKKSGKCVEIVSDKTVEEVYNETIGALKLASNKLPFEGEKIVFVLGGPGSGKGTQCDQIVKQLGYAHLSTGDLLRAEVQKGTPLGQKLEADMKEGKMVPMFEKTIGKCTFVLYFEASNEVLTARLLKRGETSGRADDNLESIKKRLKTFEEASMPVIEYYEQSGRTKKVNSEGNVEDVTTATMKCFDI